MLSSRVRGLALVWVVVATTPALAARGAPGESRVLGGLRRLAHYTRTSATIVSTRKVGDKTEVTLRMGPPGKGERVASYTLRQGEWRTIGANQGETVRV